VSQIATWIVIATGVVLGFQNCGSTSSFVPANSQESGKVTSDQIASRYSLIEQLVSQDLSCQSDADCAVVPLGSQACGGPKDYIVASVINAEFEKIQLLATELAQAESEFNASSQVVSTCMMRMPPQARCAQNLCQ